MLAAKKNSQRVILIVINQFLCLQFIIKWKADFIITMKFNEFSLLHVIFYTAYKFFMKYDFEVYFYWNVSLKFSATKNFVLIYTSDNKKI